MTCPRGAHCRGVAFRVAFCTVAAVAVTCLLACATLCMQQHFLHLARSLLQGMQGRFSGRLATKEDEKRLAAECRLIGPLLGGASRGEKSLHTLAKLVRAIAAGSVRAHLEALEAERQVGRGCGRGRDGEAAPPWQHRQLHGVSRGARGNPTAWVDCMPLCMRTSG